MLSVDDVAAWAKSINVSGVMLDYEPDTSNATSEAARNPRPACDPPRPLNELSRRWVRAYAAYVAALTESMHAVGLRAEMCISDWGILDGHTVPEGYGAYRRPARNSVWWSPRTVADRRYAATGVDRMMSMAGTYFGTNLTRNEYNVDLELSQGASLDQTAVGVGTMISENCSTGPAKWDYNWTEAGLRDFVNFVEEKGIEHLDFWRADIDNEGDCTEAYYFDVAAEFLAGGLGDA